MTSRGLYRLTAFSDDPAGGNPAGVWIGDEFPADDDMQALAADVGFSETAFVVPSIGAARTVRYFSPRAEVPFCGHATIALGVQLGAGDGGAETYALTTPVGVVPVHVTDDAGRVRAALTSVEPSHRDAPPALVDRALQLLAWTTEDLDPAIPPAVAFAGAHHLVLAVRERETLRRMDYPFDAMQELMDDHDLTTLQLVWREDDTTFHARDPFAVGGVVEDPATGAAAAALGGYLRAIRAVGAPARLTILQGVDMGRPSMLDVMVPESGGIVVAGTAVPLP